MAATPDWMAAAAAMEATIPSTTPVAQALLSRLPALASGARVVDLACGTGHPTLMVARTRPEADVVGVDVTTALVELAAEKALREKAGNVSFRIMNVESLDFPDASVDAVVSQFGVLQHGDPERSAAELARVMRPAGPFSIATWDVVERNTLISVVSRVLAAFAPSEILPDFSESDALATPGFREKLLRDAGVSLVETELLDYTITLPHDGALLGVLAQPATFGRAFASLDPVRQNELLERLRDVAARYRQGEAYAFPVSCRLFWGSR
ncbi:MAG: hypothetical protein QG671_3426 [Actinomycetota bacterium]|nr:hypothetical protein [Actinomycetota bacterium]